MITAIVLTLLTGLAFTAGALVTVVVIDRSLDARERRQALRERELVEVSEIVAAHLRVLTEADEDRGGRGY